MSKTKMNPACPNCGARNSIPIVYGYPGPQMIDDSVAGKIELGGCVIMSDQPNRRCRACHHVWCEVDGLRQGT